MESNLYLRPGKPRGRHSRGVTAGLRGLLAAAAVLLLPASAALAAFPVRTQTIELRQGWNAVFLEVEPLDTSPAKVFEGTPVDVAAQFIRPVRISQFETDPNRLLPDSEGWAIWYGPDRPESFLSDLHALHSHNAFLIHSTRDYELQITGQVYLKRIRWTADSFNLTGFPVNPAQAPTFREYFQGVPAHEGKPVYRLTSGIWRRVTDPASTVMRRGEAYWVYSEGGSDYQGPGEVKPAFSDHLRYSPKNSNAMFVLRNRSPHPARFTFHQEAGTGVALDFVLKGVLEDRIARFTAPLPAEYRMAAIESGNSGSVTLRLNAQAGYQPGGSGLLRISSDAGTEYWLAYYLEESD